FGCARIFDVETGNARRHFTFDPSRGIAITLACTSLRCRDFGQLEPGMICKQTNECLANCSGCSEDGNLSLRSDARFSHDASKVRASFSYVSTLARNSSTSMNSSGVCAT